MERTRVLFNIYPRQTIYAVRIANDCMCILYLEAVYTFLPLGNIFLSCRNIFYD